MKKIATIFLACSLLYWVSKLTLPMVSMHHPPTTIINEVIFVDMIRDLALLHSWLQNNYYAQDAIDILRHTNHQKILALYEVDPAAFNESVKYYLEDSSERALKVYEKVYIALKALSI